jgi:Ca2+/Na+ antiporter
MIDIDDVGREFTIKDIGLDVAVLGSIVSCIGVIWNNIFLDHVAAMQIWALSNVLLMIWAYGMWKHWWEDGLSGLVLCLMYAFYTVTNVYGLVMSGAV